MSFFEFPHTRTYDNDLGWLIEHCETITKAIEILENWKNDVNGKIEELEKLLDDLKAGNIPPDIANAITAWLSKNARDIIGKMVKNVWFGLTDNGYFVAYIPESWDDIIFKTTGYDFETALQENFGHLVLFSKGGA